MSDKKYYWLKLQKDFFKRHDIRIVEAMQNGKDYILFYLKLLLESVTHEGSLRFSDTIPYSEEMLSTITNTNIDVVRAAMGVFKQLGMIEVLEDSTILMNEIETMIGCESSVAERVRKHRANQKLLQCNEVKQNCNTEIEKEIELDIDKEKHKSIDYQQIADMYNNTCVSFPRCTSMSDKRKKAIKARLKHFCIDDFQRLFTMAQESDFLKGKNERNWSATFDWLISDTNMSKVLDGNYKNKATVQPKTSNRFNDFPQRNYGSDGMAILEQQLLGRR